MKDIFEQVERNINRLVENKVNWAESATEEQMQKAQNGELELMFGYNKAVPKEWLGDLKGKKVLCLAGAGGLQAPLLACAGAEVTVLDLSEKMLEKDREIAQKKKLNITLEHGNMCDLSRFSDETFDFILNPPSLFYVPDVLPVFKECYRVLKKGGSFIMIAVNPIAYVCDYVEDKEGGYYKAVNRMPYRSTDFDNQDGWVEYGHTMESYIGGQIACGFVITGYVECQMEDITELYFVTKADKN
ncbi:MAG: class I SAM-dependent methyltransferase [Lachnospiraceae bacterium]|nr:class I SAM-dependent methyltransferase [Lachnospiraceae bacterium]